MTWSIIVLVSIGPAVTGCLCEYQLQDTALGNKEPCLPCNNFETGSKKRLAPKRQIWMFHTWAMSEISIPLLPATSLLPRTLLHKGLGVLGNNWASIVAGCGRMPRLPPVLHTLFRRWAIPIYITLRKIHPSIWEGGLPKPLGNFTWTPCTKCKSDYCLHLLRKE